VIIVRAEDLGSDITYQKGNIELGGCLGTPSGLNSRYWFTEKIGIDGVLGLSMNHYPALSLDLIYEEYTLIKSNIREIRLFFGLGTLMAKEEGGMKNNIRIPAGISVPFYKYAFNLSLFAAPAIEINPGDGFEFNWGIAARYNFGTASKFNRRQRMIERRVGQLTDEVSSLKQGLDTTKGKLAKTEDELSTTKGKLVSIEGKLSEITYKLDSTEGELGLTKDRLANTTIELDGTKNQLDDVKRELLNTKKTIDDKESELKKKQDQLNKARNIIDNAFTGREKEEEEKKIAEKQEALNKQNVEFEKEKKTWEQIKRREANKRDDLKKKCEERGGIINEDGYCVCPDNEDWDPKTNKCNCVKGFARNQTTRDCDACEVIKYNGDCATGGCDETEKMVTLSKGPHKYVCIQKCRKNNEVWSKRKETCVCKDGFFRDDKGECVPRR
jgi:hypothetical protein